LDLDLCESCFNKGNVHTSDHKFTKLAQPSTCFNPLRRNFDATKNCCPTKQSEVVHWNVFCDGCEASPLIGIRYKCTTCPNYDLCEKCNIKKEELHNSNHSFIAMDKFTHPRCQRYCGNRSRPMNQSEVIHPATCDGCNNRIKGIRYKCTTCPDYDLCENCQAKKIHSEHTFSQILRPFIKRCGTNCVPNPETKIENPKEEIKVPVPEVPIQKPSPVIEKKKIEVKVAPIVEQQTTSIEKKVEVPKVNESPKVVEKKEESKVSSPFEMKLKQLEDMGFVDKIKNIEILVKNKGDMLQTVKDLLGN